MTVIFRVTQNILYFLGFSFTQPKNYASTLRGCISFCVVFSMCIPMVTYFFVHRTDIIKATEVLIQISAEFMTFGKVAFLFYNKKYVTELINNLQNYYNTIHYSKFKDLLLCEKEIKLVSKIYHILLLLAGLGHTGGPLIVILINYINGTFTSELRIHPFRGIYFFDYKSSPNFELIYLLNMIYNFYIATFYAAIDGLFLALCLHIIASLKVLENDFIELDNEYEKNVSKMAILNYSKAISNETKLKRGFRKIIEEHHKILVNVDYLTTIVNGIIFMQFVGVVIVLSTILFQVQMKGNALEYWLPGIAVLAQLFLYCYYGNKLSEQLCHIYDAVYQLNWYNYPIRYQKYLIMIMVRTQQFQPISGLGFVTCSLEKFADVLRTVASVAALFQSMNEKN